MGVTRECEGITLYVIKECDSSLLHFQQAYQSTLQYNPSHRLIYHDLKEFQKSKI